MKNLNKVLLISIIVSLVVTFSIILLPNSIYNYYTNPALNDTGGGYYFWKFLPEDKDIVARLTAWVFFILHFFSISFLLTKEKKKKHSNDSLSIYNYYLLFTNLFFIILHYIHTWIWYDALATDTPVWSSQGSVIIMLVLILVMENKRRGLLFGKKMNFPKESTRFIMKNHGIYILLATTFTFWFHPMEFTWGHLFGFFYMFLLFIQLSLVGTKIHTNKYWIFTLEILVLFHGTFVAIDTQNAPWAMFLFGFAMIFFITQIYGLGFSRKTIHISQALFVIITLVTYSGVFEDRTLVNIEEVFRIPVIDYILVFVFVYIIYIPYYIKKRKIKNEETME